MYRGGRARGSASSRGFPTRRQEADVIMKANESAKPLLWCLQRVSHLDADAVARAGLL